MMGYSESALQCNLLWCSTNNSSTLLWWATQIDRFSVNCQLAVVLILGQSHIGKWNCNLYKYTNIVSILNGSLISGVNTCRCNKILTSILQQTNKINTAENGIISGFGMGELQKQILVLLRLFTRKHCQVRFIYQKYVCFRS